MKNDYKVDGDTTVIFLSRKDGSQLETLIDTDDLTAVASMRGTWTWTGHYVCMRFGPNGRRVAVALHRFIIGAPSEKMVDHIDHDPLNNRSSNLRAVTNSINQLNRRLSPKNTSGVIGVHWSATKGQWRATVKRNGIHVFSRYFCLREDAIAARSAAYERVFAAALAEDMAA